VAAQERRLVVAVIDAADDGERRVALIPDAVAPLNAAQMQVLVEAGAGAGAWYSDDDYERAGAVIVSSEEIDRRADIVVTVGTLSPARISRLHPGQAVIGMLQPLTSPDVAERFAAGGITSISLDGLPRTVSRAQAMDALTSQANVAGYKAALVAADTFGRFFPLLITAAGTAKPASVLVLGAGVAGLQAMGTARRLGAVVTGYDVRPETQTEIRSVGARNLELESVTSASGEGGYARVLTETEQAAQQQELNRHVPRFDVVITTAQVPGRQPPLLVTAEAVKQMRPGSVVIDMAASALGGNVEGSVADQTLVTDNGVTLIGAGNLPSQVPTAASAAFSHNVSALLRHLVRDGALNIDMTDEIQAGVVITHGGHIVHRAVNELIHHSPTPGGNT